MLKKPIAILLIVILSVLSLTSVSFADADTVTILTQRASDETASSSSYIKPPKGIMTKMTYNAQLNGTNAEASLFSWSVSPENKGVYVAFALLLGGITFQYKNFHLRSYNKKEQTL